MLKAIPILFMLLFVSCLTNPVELGDHKPYVQQFLLFWDTFDEQYVGFIFSTVDWNEVYDEYLPQVENVGSQQEFIDILTEILAMFEDAHLWIYLPSGDKTSPWTPDYTPNFDMPLLWSLIDQLSEDGFHSWDSDSTWGYAMLDSIPYIMIRQMDQDLAMDPMVNFLNDHCQEAQAMIIDVRMNGGGRSLTAENISKYFCSERTLIYNYVMRDGPEHDDFSEDPIYLYHQVICYDGPAILLIGEYSASATELFAAAMDQLPQFVLAGDTTMREVNGPYTMNLAAGYEYTCATWTILLADGKTWLQETGVVPHYHVEATEDDFAQGVDPVLEFALQWAKEQ